MIEDHAPDDAVGDQSDQLVPTAEVGATLAVELALDETRQAAAVLAAAGDRGLQVGEQHAVKHAALGLAASPGSLVALEQHLEHTTDRVRRRLHDLRRISGGT